MLEILIISIGLVLVIEGTFYFLLAYKLKILINIIKTINPQIIQTISLIVALIGFCLIYFTMRYYG